MSVLERIFAERRQDVEAAKAQIPLAQLQAAIAGQEPPRRFLQALRQRSAPVGLIAEIKPASPSQGDINRSLDPTEVARDYEAAGAHCLSVLTEPRHFGGSKDNLIRAKAASGLPILRKDFLDDPYQIFESRAWGADAVLLIAAKLDLDGLRRLQDQAWSLGMDALVEVHSEEEAEHALKAGAPLIGVNSRNLATLETDLANAERILSRLRGEALLVAESALSTLQDVERVRRAGADAVLIGTAFCAALSRRSKVREVMGW